MSQVLVVDDDRVTRHLLKSILEPAPRKKAASG